MAGFVTPEICNCQVANYVSTWYVITATCYMGLCYLKNSMSLPRKYFSHFLTLFAINVKSHQTSS